MDDTERYGRVIVDQLEWQDDPDHADITWDAQAYYGGDYPKLWLKAGVHEQHADDARIEALGIASSRRGGAHACGTTSAMDRHALGWRWASRASRRSGSTSKPHYVGEESRTALRSMSATTCSCAATRPATATGSGRTAKTIPSHRSGLSDSRPDCGCVTKYAASSRRVGIHWVRRFGETADLAGDDSSDLLRRWRAGVVLSRARSPESQCQRSDDRRTTALRETALGLVEIRIDVAQVEREFLPRPGDTHVPEGSIHSYFDPTSPHCRARLQCGMERIRRVDALATRFRSDTTLPRPRGHRAERSASNARLPRTFSWTKSYVGPRKVLSGKNVYRTSPATRLGPSSKVRPR